MSAGEACPLDRAIADVLPRRSGELVFQAPWEKRAFGLAVALCQREQAVFDDLRWRVVAAITTWERAHRGSEETFRFYERWAVALERLLIEQGVLSKDAIDEKAATFASPTGQAAAG